MQQTEEETARLAAVDSYGLFGADRSELLDGLARIAASAFDVPMASVTLVHEEQQWFTGSIGLAEPGTSRAVSFSARLLGDPRPLVVPDTRDDPSTRFLPHVTQTPPIRFYAGVPLIDADGHVLGSVAVFDREPRLVGPARMELLANVSTQASAHLQALRTSRLLIARTAELHRRGEKTDDMLTTVSHELRTPTAAMLGYLEMLAEQPGAAAHRAALARIERAGQDLIKMLETVLAS
ncbi:sensor histidine kinase [Paractinoplanes durhamensis]|uniref:histidine kinase n=1 Tax=Paractinoplanes durhamensis TaxID=113563 RepID=A0ABQ3YU23_9ACTN|nr:GAF domain-containing protein [Actinoplanes durhamensis]GIE01091.1 hypothetical protein Adu01nite_24410 [Actinoplanes durhamensis]